MIHREYYEESKWKVLRGIEYRRHVVGLWLQRLACIVCGYHKLAWEPSWKDWYCLCCGNLFEEIPPPNIESDTAL